MQLTPAQAAASVGMTKAGIIRAIHKGKLTTIQQAAPPVKPKGFWQRLFGGA